MSVVSRAIRGVPPLTTLTRSLSTKLGFPKCECGFDRPNKMKIIELFQQRQLGTLGEYTKCPCITTRDIVNHPCALRGEIQKVSDLVIDSFEAVYYCKKDLEVDLSVFQPPKHAASSLFNFQDGLSSFLKKAIQDEYLVVQALVDLGGKNVSMIDSLSLELEESPLPTFVITSNPIAPALNTYSSHVRFFLDDPYQFISIEGYQAFRSVIKVEVATLFLSNHQLRHLTAEEGWSYLKTIWSGLQPGDYLCISGVPAQPLEYYGKEKKKEVDGIVEFHRGEELFLSAFSEDFTSYLHSNLGDIITIRGVTQRATMVGKSDDLLEVHDDHVAMHEHTFVAVDSYYLIKKGSRGPI